MVLYPVVTVHTGKLLRNKRLTCVLMGKQFLPVIRRLLFTLNQVSV